MISPVHISLLLVLVFISTVNSFIAEPLTPRSFFSGLPSHPIESVTVLSSYASDVLYLDKEEVLSMVGLNFSQGISAVLHWAGIVQNHRHGTYHSPIIVFNAHVSTGSYPTFYRPFQYGRSCVAFIGKNAIGVKGNGQKLGKAGSHSNGLLTFHYGLVEILHYKAIQIVFSSDQFLRRTFTLSKPFALVDPGFDLFFETGNYRRQSAILLRTSMQRNENHATFLDLSSVTFLSQRLLLYGVFTESKIENYQGGWGKLIDFQNFVFTDFVHHDRSFAGTQLSRTKHLESDRHFIENIFPLRYPHRIEFQIHHWGMDGSSPLYNQQQETFHFKNAVYLRELRRKGLWATKALCKFLNVKLSARN